MDPGQAQELMASIDVGRLILFCGAGLSRESPSLVPSATELAILCSRKCRERTGEAVPAGIEEDLEGLAEWFLSSPARKAEFRDHCVPWESFKGDPNRGHFTVADFLASGAVDFAVTTNFDVLVEKAAERLGERDFQAAAEADEMTRAHDHRGFLKLHGCMNRNRDRILWCHGQIKDGALRDAALQEKLGLWKTWLQEHLRGRDWLFVGFWSDWAYLNDVLEDLIRPGDPRLIYLVDTADDNALREKASRLWDLAHTPGVIFQHVSQSGGDFLSELRKRFGVHFIERVLQQAITTYNVLTGSEGVPKLLLPHSMEDEDLYALRRDLCGVPPGRVVRNKTPENYMQAVGAIHLILQNRGARFEGPRYVTSDGRVVRVVNGAGRLLSVARAEFSRDQPQGGLEEIVICDAHDYGNLPSDIVRGEGESTVVRSGSRAQWITLEGARNRELC